MTFLDSEQLLDDLCNGNLPLELLGGAGAPTMLDVAAWALIVPRARALGMRPLPWLALIVGTGSVGLLAMAARMLYLQNSTDRA